MSLDKNGRPLKGSAAALHEIYKVHGGMNNFKKHHQNLGRRQAYAEMHNKKVLSMLKDFFVTRK